MDGGAAQVVWGRWCYSYWCRGRGVPQSGFLQVKGLARVLDAHWYLEIRVSVRRSLFQVDNVLFLAARLI